jgi:hypothetical protein
MKPLVRLIHWHAAEAEEHAKRLGVLGYAVVSGLPPAPVLLRELRQKPPAVVVISLDRLPSQGRDVAFVLLGSKATRAVPLVFVGGTPEKVARVRAKVPFAPCTTWGKLGPVLAHALARPRATPPAAPATPGGAMAGYSGTPLPRKLGIKPDMRVALLGAPKNFAATLLYSRALPAGARLADRTTANTGLTLWFARTHREFDRGFARAVGLGARMPVWVISPKKSGPLAADLSQNYIRGACLAAGLVDYKVCAVDAAWSGLLFRRRRPAAAGPNL